MFLGGPAREDEAGAEEITGGGLRATDGGILGSEVARAVGGRRIASGQPERILRAGLCDPAGGDPVPGAAMPKAIVFTTRDGGAGLSGYTDNAAVLEGVLNQECPFLQKPFSLETLAAKVHDLLEGEKVR